MSESDLMSFLMERPHFFEIIKNRELMAVLRDLKEKGGKSATELAETHNLEYSVVKENLEKLAKANAIQKQQRGAHWIYILDFEALKLIELQEEAKKG